MDNREEAKIGMYRSVRDLLSGQAVVSIIQAAPAIGAARQDLAAIVALLEQLDIERAAAAKGDGDNKKGLRTLTLNSAWSVDGQLTAFAAIKKDAALLHQFNHEKSDYVKAGDEAFRTMCSMALGKARELLTANLPGLSGTGLTETTATILETRLAAFATVITKPEDIAKHESTMVQMIDRQFALGDELLDLVLDKLMRQFAETQTGFYVDYHNARKINDPATRSEKPPATATTGAK
jgi:hypothetical protein